MSKLLSLILSGRDDGYTGDFIDRFKLSIEKNLYILDKNDIDYEIIVVDYNPLSNNYLYLNPKLKDALAHDKVKNIIVDNSILINDGLPPNGFYEYFAKNLAAVRSTGDLLFMTNADIILSSAIVRYIQFDISKHNYDEHFYRVRYRQDVAQDGKIWGHPLDLYTQNDIDEPICGGYSGDATIFSRKVFMEIATGYNEVDPSHRTPSGQASMDGEILWNLVHKGITKKMVDLTYYHVTHPRQPKDGSYSRESYINREGWGETNKPSKIINNNTVMIYSL